MMVYLHKYIVPSALLAGAIWILFMLKTLNNKIIEHSHFPNSLLRIAETNAELNVTILKALGGDRHNYDHLVVLRKTQDDHLNQVVFTPFFVKKKSNREILESIKQLNLLIARKDKLTEQFKSQNAILKNSKTWLLALQNQFDERRLLAKDNNIDRSIYHEIHDIVDSRLHHNEFINDSMNIRQRLVSLQKTVQNNLSSDLDKDLFYNLLNHMEISLRIQPIVTDLINKNLSLPVSQNTESISVLYYNYYNSVKLRIFFLRSLLISFFLLFFFSVFQRMRRDHSSLRGEVKTRKHQFLMELEERKNVESVLLHISGAISQGFNESFFQDMTNRLTESLNIKYAFIGILSNTTPGDIETKAISMDGKKINNVCYSLTDAPCANVVGRELCCYPKDVGILFSKDQMLIDMGVDSYCGVPLFDSKNNPLGLVAVMDVAAFSNTNLIKSVSKIVGSRISDELERRKIEAALRSEKEQFSTMLGSIGDGVIGTDRNGKIILLNKEAEKLTGWSQSHALKRELHEVFNIEKLGTSDSYRDLVKRIINKGNPIVLSEYYRLLRPDGSHCLIADSSCAPIRDLKCDIVGIIVVFRDVTNIKRAEDEKKKLESQLLQFQKIETIGTLAGGIAHEFNNLLTPIIGYTQICKNSIPSSDKSYKFINRILSGAMRAKELVTHMLNFGRQNKLDFKPVSLLKIVKEAAGLILSILPKTIKVEVNIQEPIGSVLCDESQIHQVLMNVFTNAYHAMGNSGTLSITLDSLKVDNNHQILSTGQYSVITISDTGCGIAPATRDRIFDPFYTTKEVGKGSGLGLSVAHGIIKSHGGEIQLESIEGEGTNFKIFLPENGGVNLETDTAMTTLDFAEIGKNNERILFVDDENDIIEMAKVMLEQYGYSITVTDSSLDALEIFRKSASDFDLVITDYTMPDMNGLELGKKLMSIRPDIPVILITGYSDSIDRKKVMSYGFVAFIMKPIINRELYDLVQTIFSGNSLSSNDHIHHDEGNENRLKSKSAKLTILVADDNEINQEAAIEFFDMIGYKIDIAGNGNQAVQMSQKKRYDIIFMDLRMPILNGFEAVRVIREYHDSETRPVIIAMTGDADAESRKKCLIHGMDDFIGKPYTLENIQKILAKWVS